MLGVGRGGIVLDCSPHIGCTGVHWRLRSFAANNRGGGLPPFTEAASEELGVIKALAVPARCKSKLMVKGLRPAGFWY